MLQCVAVCCSVVQCVDALHVGVKVVACCSVVPCGAVWCSVVQCVDAVYVGVKVVACCSVLQSVAEC